MISQELKDLIVEMLDDSERPDKIIVKLDDITRNVTIIYEDFDDEDFKELKEELNND